MLIELDASLSGTPGGVIKATAVGPSRKAHDFLADAERGAQEILAQAGRDAAGIVEAGFQEGVRAGAGVLLAPMLEMAAALEDERARLVQSARAHVRASLEALLARSETLGPLIELIVDHHAPQGDRTVKLTLPCLAGGEAAWVRERSHALGLEAEVAIGEDNVFRMEWGAHRWESAGVPHIPAFEGRGADDTGTLSADARRRLVAKALIQAGEDLAANDEEESRSDFTQLSRY